MNIIRSLPFKNIAIGVSALLLAAVVVLITLPQWLSVDSLNRTLAEVTTPQLGEPLTVESFDWRWGAQPGLVLRGVSIGDRAQARVVEVMLSWWTLTGSVGVHKLALTDVQVDVPAWQAWWSQRPATDRSRGGVIIENLQFRRLRLEPWAERTGALDGDLQLGEDWGLTAAQISLQAWKINIKPGGQGYVLHAAADQWLAPNGITLTEFSTEAQWQPLTGDPEGQLRVTMAAERVDLPGVAFGLGNVRAAGSIASRTLLLESIALEALGGQLLGSGRGSMASASELQLNLQLSNIDLLEVTQVYELEPLGGQLSAYGVLELTGIEVVNDWQLRGDIQIKTFRSGSPGLNLSLLKSPYKLNSDGMALPALEIGGYDGTMHADLVLLWREGFELKGRAVADKLTLQPLMNDLGLQPVSGQLDGEAEFGWRSGQPQALLGLALEGEWELYNGFVPDVDLGAASGLLVRSGNAQPGTAFDVASSKLKISDGEILLADIEVKSAALAARGNLLIAVNGELRGELQVGGNESVGLTRVPVNIDGTIDDPRLRPTKSSMVGGAVGSVLLGPGLGTAVGVKVGEGLNTLKKKLFGSNK